MSHMRTHRKEAISVQTMWKSFFTEYLSYNIFEDAFWGKNKKVKSLWKSFSHNSHISVYCDKLQWLVLILKNPNFVLELQILVCVMLTAYVRCVHSPFFNGSNTLEHTLGRNHISEPKVAKLFHILVHFYSIQEHKQRNRLFKCRHCDKAFAQNCNLWDHIRMHTGE